MNSQNTGPELPTKRIVCLANSRKLNGRCVAGRELKADGPGSWIRPVSGREHHEVSEHERQYENGADPKVLDVIDVPLQGPAPITYQTENWLLEPNLYWVCAGRLPLEELYRYVEPAGPLWLNGFRTFNGDNDTIPVGQADLLQSSLRLIRVPNVDLRVFAPRGRRSAAAKDECKRSSLTRASHTGCGLPTRSMKESTSPNPMRDISSASAI
jgi:hypothetical protein